MNVLKKWCLAGVLLLMWGNGWAGGFHYTINADVTLLTNEQQRLSALRMGWVFDQEISSLLLDGYDMSDGKAVESLQAVAQQIIDDVHDLGYFTALAVNNEPLGVLGPAQYQVSLATGRIRIDFDLPLQQAADFKGKTLVLSLYDPGASGSLLFAKTLQLAAPLKQQCKAPQTKEDRMDDGEHVVVVEQVTLDCTA